MANMLTSLFNKELNGKPLDHWQVGGNQELAGNQAGNDNNVDADQRKKMWKETLSEKEYKVLREKGTEAPNSSVYNKHLPKKGHYACRACGNPLYSFKHKFESGCGWPAFGKFVSGSIETRDDYSLREKRYGNQKRHYHFCTCCCLVFVTLRSTLSHYFLLGLRLFVASAIHI